ncbi:hypothetical protein BCON_0001g00260 [Botryotinia convoluta]|uniref:Uncharacterized protein n=1 Tax=Botryotinia convoluta TaxID=54673 RepID=A0A4Z1J285_9HELO|nr:hypothetical protein BCON_0001g00260 [Botryotinia convoluta]
MQASNETRSTEQKRSSDPRLTKISAPKKFPNKRKGVYEGQAQKTTSDSSNQVTTTQFFGGTRTTSPEPMNSTSRDEEAPARKQQPKNPRSTTLGLKHDPSRPDSLEQSKQSVLVDDQKLWLKELEKTEENFHLGSKS